MISNGALTIHVCEKLYSQGWLNQLINKLYQIFGLFQVYPSFFIGMWYNKQKILNKDLGSDYTW